VRQFVAPASILSCRGGLHRLQTATGKPFKLFPLRSKHIAAGLNASSGAALPRMCMLHSQDGEADIGPFEPIHPQHNYCVDRHSGGAADGARPDVFCGVASVVAGA
jgi:hypothetical protein